LLTVKLRRAHRPRLERRDRDALGYLVRRPAFDQPPQLLPEGREVRRAVGGLFDGLGDVVGYDRPAAALLRESV